MNEARYTKLMDDFDEKLTEEEMRQGWHFCVEFDGALMGQPKDVRQGSCRWCGLVGKADNDGR